MTVKELLDMNGWLDCELPCIHHKFLDEIQWEVEEGGVICPDCGYVLKPGTPVRPI